MRILLVLLGIVALGFNGVYGQVKYTSSDKKAIKYYDESIRAINSNKWDEAANYAKEAIEEDPSFIEPYLILGDFYETTGEYKQGLQALEKAVSIDPHFYPTAYFKMAKYALELEEYDYAAQLIKSYFGYESRRKSLDETAKIIQRNAIFAREAIKQKVDFNPINLGPKINSVHDEYYPALTADDEMLLFTRKIPDARVRGIGNNPGMQEDFFLAKRKSAQEEWDMAFNLNGHINTEYNEGAPTITADGKTMVFTACELYGDLNYGEDRVGYGSCDLFISYNENGAWTKPINLGKSINSNHWETQPSLSADGRVLFFIRGKRNSRRAVENMEIMFSVRMEDGTWSSAVPMPSPINTPGNESSVLIHPDGQTLYFASTGHPGFGGEDLFVTRIGPDGEWTEPENLGYPINTSKNENSLLVSSSGDVAYFASNREGGYGGLDLYSFKLPEGLRPVPVSFTKGFVYDEETKKPLEANFKLLDLESGNLIVESKSDAKGEFLVTLPSNKDYALEVEKDGYLFYSENFSLAENPDRSEPRYLEIGMSAVRPGESVVLNNIFFSSGKYDLKKSSEVELNKLFDFLRKNADLRIAIEGHTDNVGEESDNQLLSENRAKAVYDYLVAKGISKERLKYIGYGESKPVASNDTEEGRAKNRRTVFTVL
ncbi:OmpA family protein [Luteibaculum oceani]|uniref:OmpA family protein n=1 Tax=Luteibaculum oceani TaxID=1294296 RepID=A0A5C6VAV1_9FLAO|nr:OmpA family protein [Luteibaculum oceani]TXC82000.1 OmpA family protein [Luteibaculum oceani]